MKYANVNNSNNTTHATYLMLTFSITTPANKNNLTIPESTVSGYNTQKSFSLKGLCAKISTEVDFFLSYFSMTLDLTVSPVKKYSPNSDCDSLTFSKFDLLTVTIQPHK